MQLPDFLTQEKDGWIHVTGHRIGLEHIVLYYNEGYSVEMLACQYPTLPLSLLYKLFAFYLENRQVVDAYSQACWAEVERQRAANPPPLSMAEVRRRLEARQRAESR